MKKCITVLSRCIEAPFWIRGPPFLVFSACHSSHITLWCRNVKQLPWAELWIINVSKDNMERQIAWHRYLQFIYCMYCLVEKHFSVFSIFCKLHSTHTVIKASAISVLQHEVPQGRSGISRKFSRFNFLAIARNISRLILNRYLSINLGIPRESNQISL